MQCNNEYPGLSPDVARYLRYKARQLARYRSMRRFDREDIEQELAIHLLGCLQRYNPKRLSRDSYAIKQIKWKACNLLRSQMVLKRGSQAVEVSLNRMVVNDYGEQIAFHETIDGDAVAGVKRSAVERLGLSIDLRLIISLLPEKLQRICHLLMGNTLAEAADKLGITRTSLHRYRRIIRTHFKRAGIDSGW